MKYLVQLDVSSNQLTQALELNTIPYNIQDVNLSRNFIQSIQDLSEHRFLTRLALDGRFC